jgi:hypothetical protein
MVLAVAWLAGVCCLYQSLPPGSLAVFTPALAIIPYLVACLYAVAVFCYGFDHMDLATRDSCFPARLFTLPVRTGVLIRWPMLYGTAAVALSWLVLALGVFRRSGLEVPLWCPALLFACVLAWFQALLWMPFGLPGLRVVVIVGLLIPLLVVGLVLGEKLDVPEAAAVPVLACVLGAAYLVAGVGVAHARRGDVPDWRGLFRFAAGVRGGLPARRRHFASARQAALWWLERRRGGLVLLLVGVVFLCVLEGWVLLMVRAVEQAGIENRLVPQLPALSHRANATLVVLGYFLLLPLMLAGGAALSAVRLPAYEATLPLADATLAALHLRTTTRATLWLWGLLLPAAVVWLWALGRYDALLEAWRNWLPDYSSAGVAALVLAVLLGLVAFAWAVQVKGLFLALTGRRWVVSLGMGLGLGGLMLAAFLTGWLAVHAEYRPAAWNVARALLPWLAGLALGLKVSAAAWVVSAVRRHELLTSRALACLLAGWVVAAACFFALFASVLPIGVAAWPWLAVIVVLVLPLARLAGLPLALAWNRHR